LDGSRLIGSLHSPSAETLSRSDRLCKLGAAGRSGVGIARTPALSNSPSIRHWASAIWPRSLRFLTGV